MNSRFFSSSLSPKVSFKACACAAAASLFLVACGGGGGGGVTPNAIIEGQTAGTINAGGQTVSGTLTVTDTDPGHATFQPLETSQVAGNYGYWTLTINGASATWQYTSDAALTPAFASTDSITVKSYDGTSITVFVSVAAGVQVTAGNLVTSVPAASYTMDSFDAERLAIINRLNADRSACGFGMVKQSTLLDIAAQGHAEYMKINGQSHNQTPGKPGFTGATPAARVAAAGYSAVYVSEGIAPIFAGGNSYFPISQTMLQATNALSLLYSTPYHVASLFGRNTDIGIGVTHSPVVTPGDVDTKRISLTYATPSGSANQFIPSNELVTFPCNGIAGINPLFPGENPDPYPGAVTWQAPYYGHPIYIMARQGQTVTVTAASITLVGGAVVPHRLLTAANDPNRILGSHQVFVQPTLGLADNAQYDVVIEGTNTGMVTPSNPTGAFTRSFRFGTGTFSTEL